MLRKSKGRIFSDPALQFFPTDNAYGAKAILLSGGCRSRDVVTVCPAKGKQCGFAQALCLLYVVLKLAEFIARNVRMLQVFPFYSKGNVVGKGKGYRLVHGGKFTVI